MVSVSSYLELRHAPPNPRSEQLRIHIRTISVLSSLRPDYSGSPYRHRVPPSTQHSGYSYSRSISPDRLCEGYFAGTRISEADLVELSEGILLMYSELGI